MFPCQFKIPGHSGTDVMHRKAFQKVKELRDKRKRTATVESKSRLGTHSISVQRNNSKNDAIAGKCLRIVIALLIVMLISLLIQNRANYISLQLIQHQKEIATLKKARHQSALATAYRVLTSSGNNYLYWNQLDEAQEEFARALKVDSNGEAAILGMTKTLLKKCAQRAEFCDESKTYLSYVKSMGLPFDEELAALEGIVSR